MRGQPRGEIYKGSVPTLADSTDRFLDLDTKQSVLNLCDVWSSNIHHIMNEPSVGMYRIVEHVRTKVPMMVEQKHMLKTKKVNEKIYDADYAILACKSINTNTPWIFSDSIRILKNNFVSIPIVQQPTAPSTIRKQPRPTNITTQQTATTLSSATVIASSPPPSNTQQVQSVVPPSSTIISSSNSATSETQVATQSANSVKSGKTSAGSTILTIANSNPLILDEPSMEDNVQTIEQQETEPPTITQPESSTLIGEEPPTLTTVETEAEETPSVDPTESVPTLPIDSSHDEDISTIQTSNIESVVVDSSSPTTPQDHETAITSPIELSAQGDEWSTLAIQPPSSTVNKKKKSTKKKKKKTTTEEDEELTPKTF